MGFIYKHIAGVRFKHKKTKEKIWKQMHKKQTNSQILEYDSYAPLLDVFAASDKR